MVGHGGGVLRPRVIRAAFPASGPRALGRRGLLYRHLRTRSDPSCDDCRLRPTPRPHGPTGDKPNPEFAPLHLPGRVGFRPRVCYRRRTRREDRATLGSDPSAAAGDRADGRVDGSTLPSLRRGSRGSCLQRGFQAFGGCAVKPTAILGGGSTRPRPRERPARHSPHPAHRKDSSRQGLITVTPPEGDLTKKAWRIIGPPEELAGPARSQ